jgi:hypothetical protein
MSRRTTGAAHPPQAVHVSPHFAPYQELEATYTWKISNFTRKLARAISFDDVGYLESESFFSSHGYKMKLGINLNEAPSGYAGYMGVYMHLLKSDRDGDLPWPFTKCFTCILVDQEDNLSQRQNIEAELVPEGQKHFKRPRHRENEGWGLSDFVKHSTLRTRQYIRDHAVFVKIVVEP